MVKPLSRAELDHLLDFIGYGRLEAPVWFLGQGEAGGGEQNVRARIGWQPVMDCEQAHESL
jgi:hypothetical protein